MITGGRKTCRQIVGHHDNGPMQEDQWFSLFSAYCSFWIVQHDVHPELFVLSRVRRTCVWCACLPWMLVGLACSGARAGFEFKVFSLTFSLKVCKV